jgi:hypothetical protein
MFVKGSSVGTKSLSPNAPSSFGTFFHLQTKGNVFWRVPCVEIFASLFFVERSLAEEEEGEQKLSFLMFDQEI